MRNKVSLQSWNIGNLLWTGPGLQLTTESWEALPKSNFCKCRTKQCSQILCSHWCSFHLKYPLLFWEHFWELPSQYFFQHCWRNVPSDSSAQVNFSNLNFLSNIGQEAAILLKSRILDKSPVICPKAYSIEDKHQIKHRAHRFHLCLNPHLQQPRLGSRS